MTPDELAGLFEGVKLPSDVEVRLQKVCHLPEGDVEARWVHRLIEHYFYDPRQIAMQIPAGAGRNAATSSVVADIVVYRDKQGREPFIVVEAKAAGTLGPGDVKQAESYARNLGAEYHVASDWKNTRTFKTARYIDQSTEVGNIPTWVAGHAAAEYLSKDRVLPPFRDEEHLRTVVRQCHNRIFNNLGHDPAKSFDELMKVFFCKLYDERATPQVYKFAVLPGQSKAEAADGIRELFSNAIKSARYRDVFTTKFSSARGPLSLDLDDDAIFFIVQQLQHYGLVNTTSTLEGVDIKGTVFERMVGSTFRGELGAYFTPREIVEFCVGVVDPDLDGKVLDPSCGSGGFLIMVIKHIQEKIRQQSPNLDESEIAVAIKGYCDSNITGVDINERMVRVSKMNMIMHGDGHAGILNMHGLDIGTAKESALAYSEVDYIFSNPPFAGREADPNRLTRFSAARTEEGAITSLHKTIPFVEMIVRLLRPGGVAALVLPNGVFNSPSASFARLREIIFAETEILAVIGLPHWVFFHTGCDVQGSLLFLKKGRPKRDYKVFIDWADNVGFDVRGAKAEENDLPAIRERYRQKPADQLFSAALLKANGRFDPLYYRPGKHAVFFARKDGHRLRDLVEPGGVRVSRARRNIARYQYLEVGGADPETGRILELTEYAAEELPSRARWIVREGMILLPNHRNSIASGRSPVFVSQEHDGIVVTSRFIPLFCKVPAAYVYHLLDLPIVKEKLLTTVTGSSSTEIKWEAIADLPVPVPGGEDYDTFLSDVLELESKIENYREQMAKKQAELKGRFANLFA